MKRLFLTLTLVLALPLATLAALAPDGGPPAQVHVEFRFAHAESGPDREAFQLDGATWHLDPEILLDESAFALASARRGRGDVWHVEVILTEDGARLLGEITTGNLERRLGMVVDGKLLSAPIIRAPITQGRALISGNIGEYEARRIAAGVMARHAVQSD
ncbi:MAG: hypothetical protein GY838_03310 [bacterium]|nr:hypothetical protein [bacterium]